MKIKKMGFTLIELIIAIVVLGILSAIALPKFIDMRSDSNISIINSAVANIKSGVSLFKSKTVISNYQLSDQVEFSGVTGSHYQPWAAAAIGTGFTSNYTSSPEIFESAGLKVEDWAYRIYVSDGSYAVSASPKNVLQKSQPTESEVKLTNCYFTYHWKLSGEPEITTVMTEC